MADTSNVAQLLTDLKAKERIWVDQSTGITYDRGKMNKPVEVFSGYGLRSPEKVTAVTDWSLGANAIEAIQAEQEAISAVSASNGKDNDASDISILSDEVVTFAGVNGQAHKAAATAEFMSNYNDNQLYEVSPGNNTKVVDLNQNLNDEILGINDSNTSINQMINDGIPVHETLVVEADKRGSYAGSYDANMQTLLSKDHKKTHISVETKAAESAALTEVIESVNAQANEKAASAAAGAKKMGLAEWDTAPYVQDRELGTYEDDERMQTMYAPAVIEAEQTALLEKQRIKDELAAEKAAAEAAAAAEARAKQQAIQAAKREKYQNRAKIAKQKKINKELEEERQNVKRLGEDQDPFEGGTQGGSFDNQGGAGDKTHLHNEEAFTKGIADEVNRRADNYKKRIAELDRIDAEKHGGQDEAGKLNPTLQAELDRIDAEKHGGDDFHAKKRQLDRIDEERHGGEGDFQNAGRGSVVEETGARGKHLADVLSANQEYIDKLMNQGGGSKRKAMSNLHITDPGKGKHGSARKGRSRYGFDRNSLVSTDPYAFSTFAYPKDVVEDFTNGHYMLFYINAQNYTKYTYDGYDDTGKVVTVGDMIETEKAHEDVVAGKTIKYKTWHMNKGANAGDIAYSKRTVAKGRKGNLLYHNQTVLRKGRKAQTGLSSYYPTTTRITDSVALYLPPNVQDSTNASYNDFETGMAGFLAMGGVNILQQLRDHDFQGAASILMSQGTEIANEALKKFALGGFGALTGSEGVRETFDKAFGQSLNPYLEVTFNNMGLRSFNYTFHFAPKSPEESLEVKDIIQLFRFHMAPELKGTNHRYLTIPSTFDIHYMFQSGMGDKAMAEENSFYSKIATCVLKGVDVNYTPGGVRSFDDGAPTQIDMTLNFQETEMLTKQKINEGF